MPAVRNPPDADRTAIDGLIFQRFGCTKAVMFTDLVIAVPDAQFAEHGVLLSMSESKH
jgi:hypothetical protein